MSKIDETRKIMMDAMKAKDKDTKDAASALLTALKNAAIDKRADLTEEEENTIVKKEIRTLQETIDTAPSDRTDIISAAQKRIDILKTFAPADMTADEIHAVIKNVLADMGLGTPSAKDKGAIMKNLMPLVKGKADGKLVNEIVSTYFS